MKRLLVIDDHAIVRQGFIRIVEEMQDYVLTIDEAGSEQEALLLAEGTEYDLVLLDISLQGRNGIDLLKQLKRLAPKVPVLMLSMYPVEQYAARAIRAGASGYITKEGAATELQSAVRKVLSGGRYLTESVAESLADAIADERREKPADELLSDREFQVICMMASGKTMTEIADTLNLSIKTISTYRNRILEKLNLRTTGEIIAYAVSSGLGKN